MSKITVNVSTEALTAIQALVYEQFYDKYGKAQMDELLEYAKEQGWTTKIALPSKTVEDMCAEFQKRIEEYFATL